MKKQILIVSDGSHLTFTGSLFAEVSGARDDNGDYLFKKELKRWESLRLYKTKTGCYACHKIKFSNLPDEIINSEAKFCKDTYEITQFFSFSDLAERLYKKSGIDIWKTTVL